MQRGNRYERAAKLGASCLREIFLEIRRYTFEQDNIAAILPHEQVAYGVSVVTIQMGKGAGQVPLDQLAKHIKKLPKQLTPAKVGEVNQRLRALDAMRPKAPIPKGPT